VGSEPLRDLIRITRITKVLGLCTSLFLPHKVIYHIGYTLSEAWSGVNWADLMAAQGAFGADFYDRSTRKIVGTMLWTEYRPVIKIGPKGALQPDPPNSLRSKPRTEYVKHPGHDDDVFFRLDIDITELRKRWFNESRTKKQVETRLLASWRDLKRMRDEQGFRNTGIELVSKELAGPDATDWEKQFSVELEWAKNDAEQQYEIRKREYEEELEKWQQKSVSTWIPFLHLIAEQKRTS